MIVAKPYSDLSERVGQDLGHSEWLTIDQDLIDKFADVTGDHMWVHSDPARAGRELPGGRTIAHGLLTFSLIMPIGYPAVPPKEGVRRPLADMVHQERFDMSKYMSNKDVVEYLYRLREKTVPVYSHSYAGRPPVADKSKE